MLAKFVKKVKQFFQENRNDLYIAAIIFLVGLSSFGLGRLSTIWPKKEPIRIENPEPGARNQENDSVLRGLNSPNSKFMIPDSRGEYVASKNGTVYHLPWCSGVQRIKEENKIWFKTKEDAEKQGYKPAANCEGL